MSKETAGPLCFPWLGRGTPGRPGAGKDHSTTRAWMIRRLLTRPFGRTFAVNCSAGYSTLWWLDHRHPPSRTLSGTRSIFSETRFSLQESAVCTRPLSMVRGRSICRGVLPCATMGDGISGSMSPCFQLACTGTSLTDFRLPSVGADRSALLGNRGAVRRPPRRAVSPDPGSQVVGNGYGHTAGVGRVQLQCSAHSRLLQLRTHPPCSHYRQSLARKACFLGPTDRTAWLCRGA